MDTSAETNKIVSQAAQWSFEGDCSLLQLMQKISLNLEQHANKTNQALNKLTAGVKRTNIALDNAANSLTALQYTHFVESRCHEDDETIANIADVPLDVISNNHENVEASSGEILKTFLENNLKMLHNCHEKYLLDLEESDDEDGGANNCIYHPKNPYNDRPLPHIYGTKLWKENWHVGLCDGTNDYSGDETSEEFSESSTSADDNESFESSSAQISEWASSTSMLQDKHLVTNIAIQSASSLRGSQQLSPEEQRTMSNMLTNTTPAVAESNTSSHGNVKTAPRFIEGRQQHDLFASLRTTPPSSLSSIGASASSTRDPSQTSSYSGSSSQRELPQPHTRLVKHDLFEDMSTSTTTKQSFDAERKPSAAAIKRKPVNLFDDDDFNNFMADIVDKAQIKTNVPPIAAPRKTSTAITPDNATYTIDTTKSETGGVATTTTKPKSAVATSTKVVDLFDSRSNSPELTQTYTPPMTIAAQSVTITKSRNKPLNLFESPETSPSNEPLFSSPEVTPNNRKATIVSSTKLSAKSLFDDDDDDDDDFLNVFGTRKVSLPNKPMEKTFLFNDDATVEVEKDVRPTKLHVETENKADAAQSVVANTNYKKTIDQDELRRKLSPRVKGTENNLGWVGLPKKDQMDSKTAKVTAEIEQVANNTANVTVQGMTNETAKLFGTDLFGSDHEDDEDLFNQPKNKMAALISAKHSAEMETQAMPKATHTKQIESNKYDTFTMPHENEHDTFKIPSEPVMVTAIIKPLRPNVQSEGKEITEAITNVLNPNASTVPMIVNPSNATYVKRVDKEAATAKPITVATNLPASNYTNIFLDEPPDDDDFFQALSSSTFSASKIGNELEPDYYEPALPQPPATTRNDTNNPKENATTTSAYSGLRLFSDVPPDDDHAANDSNISTSNRTAAVGKHLHSVFYDDLKETREAIPKLTVHSLFGDEPPTIDDDVDFASNAIKPKDTVFKTADSSNEIVAAVLTESPLSAPDETDKAITCTNEEIKASKNTLHNTMVTTKKPTSNLLPKININVQALLPGAVGGPSFKKSTETKIHSSEDSDYQVNGTPVAATVLSQALSEHILTSLCKERVRAPAKRRPSTRRGRQEYYRNSLLAEEEEATAAIKNMQADLEGTAQKHMETLQQATINDSTSSPQHLKAAKQRAASQPSKVEASIESIAATLETTQKTNNSKTIAPAQDAMQPSARMPITVDTNNSTSSRHAALFLDDDNDANDDFLFGSNRGQQNMSPNTETVSSALFGEIPPEDELFPATGANATGSSTSSSSTKKRMQNTVAATGALFDDTPPEDTLFSSVPCASHLSKEQATVAKSENTKFRTPKGGSAPSKLASSNVLFADSPPEDSFLTTQVPITSATVTRAPKSASIASDTWLTDSATENLPFSTEQTMRHIQTTSNKSTEMSGDMITNKSLFSISLFDDTPPEETSGKETLAVPSVPSMAIDATLISNPLPKATKSQLFLDSDDNTDADDLFASKSTKTDFKTSKQTAATAIPQLSANKSASIEHAKAQAATAPRTKTNPPSIQATTQKVAKSLFSDGDSDSDGDLFKSHSPVTQVKAAAVAPQLFGSDSDDNDVFSDAFSAAKNKHKNPTTKTQTKNNTTKQLPTKDSNSLFSDAESDGDDLFSAKTKKVFAKTATTPTPHTSSGSKQNELTTPSRNDKLQDNPLADLL